MKRLLRYVQIHILRGLLAVIPIALSVLAIGFLYVVIDRRVMDLVDQLIGFRTRVWASFSCRSRSTS